MSDFNKQKLLELMQNIAPGAATAEHESDDHIDFLKNFLPVPDYRRALEPDTFLILGGRGVGKTELFRLLAIPSGRITLVENLKIRALPTLDKTTWIAAFGRTQQRGKIFPSQETIETVMQNANNLDWRAFWIGLMLGIILRQNNEALTSNWAEVIPPVTRQALLNNLSLLSDWFPLVRQELETINHALELLDEKLIETDEWLFITYDELDRLVSSYNKLAAPIGELLAFWLDRWRRWERIRPKIFLRTDLFREEFLGFPDASKLKAHQINLEWKHSWLYQLFFKRLANSGQEMADYLQIIPNFIKETNTDLGIMVAADESIFESMIEKIIGKFMGANARKGYTYRWIPNHLQDAGRRIAPRSFLNLFSLAASRRLEKLDEQPLPETTLLHPSDLQGALMETSKDRIRELAHEEYPWLESLKTSLKGLSVPIEKSIFLEAIANTTWNEKAEKLPFITKPEEVIEYLLQLGIIESLSEERINMPEIYLYGFEVKRKGGIKRPK
ncbi:P-loop ATPase, Sll1717 family [Anabaena sp. WFMT]|uniref:P-loop ATPase, Sll1717 family n=1 Tax=Anabaena sp. WFMT TaxID=3449730 RepID=UPI003F278F10